jgi:hypothetical protein
MDAGKEKLEKKAMIDGNTKVHVKEMKIISVQFSTRVNVCGGGGDATVLSRSVTLSML